MQLYYPLSDKELFLMRGYPGSGKSTTARQLAQLFGSSAVVYSTDDFFHTDGNPNNEDSYQFDVSKLADYHSQNIARTIQAMKDEIRLVIVDNTNLTLLNMQPYVQAALDQGYHVNFLYSDAEWKDELLKCFTKQTHGVPREVFQTMQQQYQYPNQTKIPLQEILAAKK